MQYRTVGVVPRLRDSFWRHRWLFILSVLTVSIITAAALALRKPAYYAAAATQVVTGSQELADAIGQQERFSWVTPSQTQVNRLNDLLNDDSPDGFLDTSLRNAQLHQPIAIDPRQKDPRAAKLRKSLAVTPDSANLFTVGLTWDDPAECERIVKALQDQFIEVTGVDRQANSVAVTKFLESEIKNYERRMRKAEQALIEYKRDNSGQLPEAQTADLQQLASLRTQRDNLLVSAQDSALRRKAVEKRMAEIEPMSVLEQTVADGPNAQVLREMIAQRASLLAQGFQPASERVRDLEERMTNVRRLAAAEVTAAARSGGKSIVQTKLQNNPEYQSLSQQLTDALIAERSNTAQLQLMGGKIAEYEARIRKIPAAQRELTDKTRDYTILKSQYENLLTRREDAQLRASLDRITARSNLIPVGTVYAQPTTPRSKQILMLVGGVVVGFMVGVAVVVLSEWGDTTLRYGVDAERLLEIPVLAEVPELRGTAPALAEPAPPFPPPPPAASGGALHA